MNTPTPFLPATVRFRGLFAEQRRDGRWLVRGRGAPPAVKSHEELTALLNAKPKRPNGRQQPRK